MSITREGYYGRARHEVLTDDSYIINPLWRAQTLWAVTTPRTVTLPDARLIPSTGGPVVTLSNMGSVDITVRLPTLATLFVLGVGQSRELVLFENTTPDGRWRVFH